MKSVYGEYIHYDWNGTDDVNLSHATFSERLSSISIEDTGYGYSMPCEVIILGGFPQWTNVSYDELPAYAKSINDGNSTGSDYNFTEAKIIVTGIDENGAITDLNITNPGKGYVPYKNFPKTDPSDFWPELNINVTLMEPRIGLIFTELDETTVSYPLIIVTGGGGHGAVFSADVNESDGGSISGWNHIFDFFEEQDEWAWLFQL